MVNLRKMFMGFLQYFCAV